MLAAEQLHLVGYSGGRRSGAGSRISASGAVVEPGAVGTGVGRALGSEPGREGTLELIRRGSRRSDQISSCASSCGSTSSQEWSCLHHRRGILRPDGEASWGIRAFMRTFRTYDLDRGAPARFDRPVYFALGGLSNPDQFAAIATRLSRGSRRLPTSRCSRSGITLTRRIESNPIGSRTRCEQYGVAATGRSPGSSTTWRDDELLCTCHATGRVSQ